MKDKDRKFKWYHKKKIIFYKINSVSQKVVMSHESKQTNLDDDIGYRTIISASIIKLTKPKGTVLD